MGVKYIGAIMIKELTKMEGEEFIRKVLAGERDFSNLEIAIVVDDTKSHARWGLNKLVATIRSDSLKEMSDYLMGKNLQEEPIILDCSSILIRANGIYLPYVKARGIYTTGSSFRNAELRYADFSRLVGKDVISWDNDFRIGTIDSWLSHCDFKNCNLEGADFSGSHLLENHFIDCELRKSQFYSILTDDTKFIKSNLERAEFVGANLNNSEFNGANLKDADFKSTDLYFTRFIGAKELASVKGLEFAIFNTTYISPLKDREMVKRRLLDSWDNPYKDHNEKSHFAKSKYETEPIK